MARILLDYVPFVTPLPVWDVWYLTLLPLCLAVAVVYKTVKCRTVSDIPRESLIAAGWILLGLVAAALALVGVLRLMGVV